MGQKVNPILFRSKYRKVDSSSSLISPPQNSQLSHSIIQDIEVKKFLYFLLLSKGIFLRSCSLKQTPEKLLVNLDMYFTSLFFKRSKLRWVRYFFRTMKKEEPSFKKIKEVKGFVDTHFSLEKKKKILKYLSKTRKFQTRKFKIRKNVLVKKNILAKKKQVQLPFRFKRKVRKKQARLLYRVKTLKAKKFGKVLKFRKVKKVKNFEVFYRRRLFYILCYQKKKELFVSKEEDQEGVPSFSQLHKKPGFDFVRTNTSKLSRFFGLRRLKYSFYSMCLSKFLKQKRRDQSLLDLNKYLGQVLQNYYGLEQVCIKMTSMQLFLLPFLKRQKKVFVKKLSSFQRNRSLQKYFSETVELFYFLHVCFSKGNAFLLAKYIAYLLEKNRKQIMIVKFLRKCMQAFFTGLSRISSKRLRKRRKNLPDRKILKSSSLKFIAISGMRILIKGRLNKRRRTKKFLFSSGQFSLQTMDLGVDYYQTQANTIYGSFGIKVWIAKRK